ncbi:MAG: hypothetical protein ABIH23_04585, partial [bacterium]
MRSLSDSPTIARRRFSLTAFLTFVLSLYCIPSSATTLTIAEQKHVFGGEFVSRCPERTALGVPVAWSGSGFAMTYYEYGRPGERWGDFLLLLDDDGDPAAPPIRLTEGRRRSVKILWDGANYICLIGEITSLRIKRFSPDGEIESEAEVLGLLEEVEPVIRAFLVDGVIHTIRESNYNGQAEWIDLTVEGEQLSEPLQIYTRGNTESCVYTPHGIAAVSRLYSRITGYILFLDLFDLTGSRIGFSEEIKGIHWRPWPALHWNGSHFVSIAGMYMSGEGQVVVTLLFDRWGKRIGDPTSIGPIPEISGHLSSSELIWTGSEYLAVWNRPCSGDKADIWIRMLDSRGLPTSEAVKINNEPMDEPRCGTVLTDDGFVIFSVEEGEHSPSISYTRLVADSLSP